MSIPYLKGWGASIKDAADELTPALKSLKDQNWKEHEAIKINLLDPVKLQTYANLYHENQAAFDEKAIGKENLKRIQAMSSDPSFILERSQKRAAADWSQKNPAIIGQLIASGQTPQQAEIEARRLEALNRDKVRQADIDAYVSRQSPEEQTRILSDEAWRTRTGVTKDQADAQLLRLKQANEDNDLVQRARDWADKNKKIINSPLDLAKAIRDGAIDNDMLGGLSIDDRFKGQLSAAYQILNGDISRAGQEASQGRLFAQQEAMQGRAFEQQDKLQQERLAQAASVRGKLLRSQISSMLYKINTSKELSADELEKNQLPALQAQLDEIAQIEGSVAPRLSIAPTGFFGLGKGTIAYAGADGKPTELRASNLNRSFVKPEAEAPSTPSGSSLDDQFLARYKGSSLADQNQYYERADPSLKAKIDQWIKEGKIPDPRQPGGK